MENRVVFLAVTLFVLNHSYGQNHDLIQSTEPPVIPVGEDAYLMWDHLPNHRIGVRAYMRSTYDRQGNNRTADASHFLYQESDTFNVTLDVKGPGILYFKRTNFWHGSPWHYETDGENFIVSETATADPVGAKERIKNTTFIPEKLFPNPLTWTWSVTKGADLSWVPIPFEESFRLAYGRTFYGTGYYIYHLFAPGIKHISKPLESWEKTPPDPDVLDLLSAAGTDIAPKGDKVDTYSGELSLDQGQWTTVVELDKAPATIRALKFSVPLEDAFDFGKCRLRITWDNRWHSSVDVPLDLFFGAGQLYNPENKEYLVRGLPFVIRYDDKNVYLSSYYPMPFFKHARIEIQERHGENLENIEWEVRTMPYEDPVNHAGYFHATYSDHPSPVKGKDLVFLDTDHVEGGGPWSGKATNNEIDLVNSAYRFLIADIFPFGKRAVIALEHGPKNESLEHYSGVVYWYGAPGASLILTNELNVCNEKSIQDHQYNSPTAEKPYSLVSRYELGPDGDYESWDKKEDELSDPQYYPAEEDLVRIMKGTTQFEVNLIDDNIGVMLRRKFDYSYPNQNAKIFVRSDKPDAEWSFVGLWYTAGSNTCVFSYPKSEGELGKTEHHIVTSNRQWREEEFLIPRHFTEGVERLAVKIEFVPNDKALFPGEAFPLKSAWSESRYWIYCYKMPILF